MIHFADRALCCGWGAAMQRESVAGADSVMATECFCAQVQSCGVLEQSSGGGDPHVDSGGDRVHLGAVALPRRARGHRIRRHRLQLQEPNHAHLHAEPPE